MVLFSPIKSYIKGYSLVELLGVMALIVILLSLAIFGVANFSSVAKESAAQRNAAALNAGIEQFNQSGGFMTAQVHRKDSYANAENMPEVLAFCLLASSAHGGPYVSPHQYPIISADPDDYRVVFISGVTSSSPEEWTKVMKTLGGFRNIELEHAIESGTVLPAQFVVIGPNLPLPAGIQEGTPGIVSFSRSGLNLCGPNNPSLGTPPPNVDYALTLNVVPAGAGTVTGSGTYAAGSIVSVTSTAGTGWVFERWDGDLGGSSQNTQVQISSNMTASAIFKRETFDVVLEASPPEGGSVTGSGTYEYGQTLTYSITPNANYSFTGWSGDITGATTTGTLVVTAPITASAGFVAANYPVEVLSGVGGVTNPSAGSYIIPAGRDFRILANPTWSDNWNSIRYRWDSFEVVSGGTSFAEVQQDYRFEVTNAMSIQPVFVRQQFVRLSANNTAWGSLSVGGSEVGDNEVQAFDRGSSVTVVATPIEGVSKFVRWSDGNTNATRTLVLHNDIELTAIYTNMQTVTVRVIDQAGAVAVPGSYQLSGVALGNFQAPIGQPIHFSFIPRNPSSGIGGSRSYTLSDISGPVTYLERTGGSAYFGINGVLTPTSNASDVITIRVNTMTFTYYYNDTAQHYGHGRWRPGFQRHYDGYYFWVVNEVQYYLGPFGNPVYYSTSGNHNQIRVFRRVYQQHPPGTPITSFSASIPADAYWQQGSSAGLSGWNPHRVDHWDGWR